jgi:predicted MFS family arabinose efflux permease
VWLGSAGFCISAGLVLTALSVFALLPGYARVGTQAGGLGAGIAKANALLEFGRACVALGAPVVAAVLIARGVSQIVFVIAAAGGLLALLASWQLPSEPPVTTPRIGLLQSIREGARFVIDEPILRAIALCAIAWNSAFFALTAVLAPYAIEIAGLSIEQVGQAWAVYGAGLLIGAFVAPHALSALPTGFLFVFGPLSSLFGVTVMALLVPRYGQVPLLVGLFSLGFGPMLWLVLQTSVRQILTPPQMLGRVAATITTTIYGVRPIGALAAGLIATQWGTAAAVWLSVGLFALSVLAMVRSPAMAMRDLPRAAEKAV